MTAVMRRRSSISLDLDSLVTVKTPSQEMIGDIKAAHLGLGHVVPENLSFRKSLGMPGSPYGGLGFFDPQKSPTANMPEEITADVVRNVKLQEFDFCSNMESVYHSIYFWALHPIFDADDRAVGAEILVRARNGSDSAPFEDIKAMSDPNAPTDVLEVYARWKSAEIVDWTLKTMREHPVLQGLEFISSNVRPSDLHPNSLVFKHVSERLERLSEADRTLLLDQLVIEITEYEELSKDDAVVLQNWKDMGFRLAFDDTIGMRACDALGQGASNFHTTEALEPILDMFEIVKVDIEWAGYALFLSHPSYASRPAMKAEILQRAKDEDLVYVPAGQTLRNTGYKYSVLLSEFAVWAKKMVHQGKKICVECTIRQDDENNSFALEKLAKLGIDPFGEDQALFCFQGGLCGPKAFPPEVFATGANIYNWSPCKL